MWYTNGFVCHQTAIRLSIMASSSGFILFMRLIISPRHPSTQPGPQFDSKVVRLPRYRTGHAQWGRDKATFSVCWPEWNPLQGVFFGGKKVFPSRVRRAFCSRCQWKEEEEEDCGKWKKSSFRKQFEEFPLTCIEVSFCFRPSSIPKTKNIN